MYIIWFHLYKVQKSSKTNILFLDMDANFMAVFTLQIQAGLLWFG